MSVVRILSSTAVLLSVAALAGCKLDVESAPPPTVAGVGDKLQAFMTQAAPDAETKCLVCEFGGKPTLIAVGDPDDTAFAEDLLFIQTLVAKDDRLKAFAVGGRVDKGKWAPLANRDSAYQAFGALKEKQGVTFPLVMLPVDPEQYVKQGYRKFDDSYRLAGPRMVFFAGADGKVLWAESIKSDGRDKQLAALESTVLASL